MVELDKRSGRVLVKVSRQICRDQKGCVGRHATHRTTDDGFCLGFSRFFRGYEYFREGRGNIKINCNEQQEIYESDLETLDDGTWLQEIAEQKVERFQKFERCTSLVWASADRPRRSSRLPQESCMCLCLQICPTSQRGPQSPWSVRRQ